MQNFLAYRTTRRVKMKVPMVGAVYRLAQLGAFVYVVYTIYAGNLWAEVSEPRGIIEANPESGTSRLKTDAASFSDAFCGNEEYRYSKGPTVAAAAGGGEGAGLGAFENSPWETPVCRGEEMPMVAVKGETAVHFSTAIHEIQTFGFPCGTHAPPACDGRSTLVEASGQCYCEVWETAYPVGIEDMHISVDHAYRVDAWNDEFGWFGSSVLGSSSVAAAAAEGGPQASLDTTVVFRNGTRLQTPAGNRLSLAVGTWLDAAGVSLDARNEFAKPDAEDGRYPFFRTTGVRVEVVIKYGNLNPAGQGQIGSQDVNAEISVRATEAAVAGLGPTAFYAAHPSGPRGNATFHRVTQYRQGVVVSFSGTGKVYRFNLIVFLTELVLVKIYLSLAVVLADLLAVNMYRRNKKSLIGCSLSPASRLLRNKRDEQVSIDGELAEVGLRMSMLTATFQMLDADGDGQVELDDIVAAFAKVDGVPFDKAMAIAQTILRIADDGRADEDGTVSLNFPEFVSLVEGDTLDFENYLQAITTSIGSKSAVTSRDDICRRRYEEAQAKRQANGGKITVESSEKFRSVGLRSRKARSHATARAASPRASPRQQGVEKLTSSRGGTGEGAAPSGGEGEGAAPSGGGVDEPQAPRVVDASSGSPMQPPTTSPSGGPCPPIEAPPSGGRSLLPPLGSGQPIAHVAEDDKAK